MIEGIIYLTSKEDFYYNWGDFISYDSKAMEIDLDQRTLFRKKLIRLASLAFMVFLTITACSTTPSPAAAIENYLQALADKDEAIAVSFSCGAWEEKAVAEGSSFINVEVTLENLSCQVASEEGDQAVVSCSGRYVFSYDAGEDQELDLSGRKFSAVRENNQWRMCGYVK